MTETNEWVNDIPVYGGTLSIFGSYFIEPDFHRHRQKLTHIKTSNRQCAQVKILLTVTQRSFIIGNNFWRKWSEKEDDDGQVMSQEWMKYALRSKHYTVGSHRIQEKTWKTNDKLERHSEQGPSKNGINLGRGWSISSGQTDLASTCDPTHRRCWMNQIKSSDITSTTICLYAIFTA